MSGSVVPPLFIFFAFMNNLSLRWQQKLLLAAPTCLTLYGPTTPPYVGKLYDVYGEIQPPGKALGQYKSTTILPSPNFGKKVNWQTWNILIIVVTEETHTKCQNDFLTKFHFSVSDKNFPIFKSYQSLKIHDLFEYSICLLNLFIECYLIQ